MNALHDLPTPTHATPAWGDDPVSRVPGWVYTDPEVYRQELDRFFYKGHWCYVGLECEVPEPGDFKRTAVGERSVILVRDAQGTLRVVENRCAHRGVAFCRERHGRVKEFVCPYHQWNYNLKGELIGLPFRRGVKAEGGVQGGMPADFKLQDHGLTQLQVATRGGAVFASFDADVESFEDYLGPEVLHFYDRVFHGRKLELLGYNRVTPKLGAALVVAVGHDPLIVAGAHGSGRTADPMDLPNAMARVLGMAPGTRPVRLPVSGGSIPQSAINEVCAKTQVEWLGGSPLGPLIRAVHIA